MSRLEFLVPGLSRVRTKNLVLRIGFIGTFILLYDQILSSYGSPLAMFVLSVAVYVSLYYFRKKRKSYHLSYPDSTEELHQPSRLDLAHEKNDNRGYVRADGRYSMLYL